MFRITGLILAFCFSTGFISAQTSPYPKGYFRWPLELKPEIVANLGELRSNHWHMGLDIRTAQQVNKRVLAAADGYIAYVGIRPLSFGRFIIINHANGLSTLYAHLNNFEPALEKYVTEQQYLQESWAVELAIPAGLFPVKKGTFISYSGTTGGSQGPHVHFEIRNTKTGKCLNPLLFGMPLRDAVKPVIAKLAMYDRTQSIYKSKPRLFAVKNSLTGATLTAGSVIKTGSSRVSLGLQTYDQITGSPNRDGIYAAELYVDGVQQIKYVIDSVGYDETRYMNAHIDYSFDFNGGAYLQHLSRLPGNHSSVYQPQEADGVIHLTDKDLHDVRVVVYDAYTNKTTLQFKIQYDPASDTGRDIDDAGPSFVPNYVNILEKPDFELYMKEDAVYDTVSPFYYRTAPAGVNAVTAMHQLNDPSVPLHSLATVRIKPEKPVPDEWKDKLVIERSYRGSRTVRKADWQDGWLAAEFSDFGFYRGYVDLEPPVVPGIGSGDTVNMSGKTSIVFTPTDNFGIKSFRAELNGNWLRFTNDKARTWIYKFDERCPYGVHHLRVRVEDLAGNITIKQWWFKRSAYRPPVKKAPVRKTTSKAKPAVKKPAPRKK